MSSDGSGLQLLEFDDAEAGLLAYSIGGKITAEQAQEVWDRVDAAAQEGRKLRVFYEMHSFATAEASVFLEKLKRVRKLLDTIERLALVGDQRWLSAYQKIADPLTKLEMRHFHTDERDAALAWLRESE